VTIWELVFDLGISSQLAIFAMVLPLLLHVDEYTLVTAIAEIHSARTGVKCWSW